MLPDTNHTHRTTGLFLFFSLLVLTAVACGTTTEPTPTLAQVAQVPDTPTPLPTAIPPVPTVPPTQAETTVTVEVVPVVPTNTPAPTLPPTPRPNLPTNTPIILTNTPTNTPTPTFTPSVTATNTPIAPVGDNWFGEYFNNTNLSGEPAMTRNDAGINFNWGAAAPANILPADNFSVRWTRTLAIPSGTYTFYVRSDDGARLYLDDQIIINEWHGASNTTYSVQRSFAATADHELVVEYYEGTGTAQIQVWWEQSGQFPQWRGEYYGTVDLSGVAVIIRNDPNINFDWGSGSPDGALASDNFSVRWTRTVSFDAGYYYFFANMDDGVRVYVDSTLVINDWNDGGAGEVSAGIQIAQGNHLIKVEYYERGGNARANLRWERLGDTATTPTFTPSPTAMATP